MKIKVFQAVAICNILGSVNQAELGKFADKVVDIYMGLLPLIKEYNEALNAFQTEARGKRPLTTLSQQKHWRRQLIRALMLIFHH